MEFVKKIHQETYNNVIVSYTKYLYQSFLKRIDNGSSIVDIGIGNGEALLTSENIKLIKDKDLMICGFDVNQDYLKNCQRLIKENKLEKRIFCFEKDLSKENFNFDKKVDYVYFSNSYAVIPEVSKLLKNIVKIFQPDKIVISITLSDNEVDKFIKPYAKYLMLGVDFGRAITRKEFMVEMKDYRLVREELTYENESLLRTFKIFTFYFLT